MARTDSYEKLCRFYEIMVGRIPDRDQFKEALRRTVAEADLDIFFELPLSGNISFSKLLKKSRLGEGDLLSRLKHLASEGFILLYEADKGLSCERGNPVFMTEQQVRKHEDTVQRKAYAEFFNRGIEGDLEELVETKTPYYRILSAEPALINASSLKTIEIDVTLPAPGAVLPIDQVTVMIKNEARVIGVAKCFCRLAKKHLHEGCDHALETCFVFNELAQSLIDYGTARRIDYDEAIQILQNCESEGLVHNIDNCTTEIRSLCNCCPCCCIVLKSIKRGESFAGSSSRYMVRFDREKCKKCAACIPYCPTEARVFIENEMTVNPEACIGCGLCVTACPEAANSMVPRKKKHKLPNTYTNLYGKIGREAMISIAKKKIWKTSS